MDEKIKSLYRASYAVRIKTIEMVHHANNGHAAPGLSMADIITALYFDVMNIDPSRPKWDERDRFVLSKGHACPSYYAALALRGYFPVDELMEYRMLNTKLQGHPDMNKCPGVDMTTGSLGNGFSAALGLALAAKLGRRQHRVYAIAGDGELQEGIVWEAAMYAGNAKLDNLTVFIDRNGLQSGGNVENIQALEDLRAKFAAFGWNVLECDGHSMEEIAAAAQSAKDCKGKPTVIIAHTTKGKGVSFMENQYLWHMKAPNDEQFAQAMAELTKEARKYE